MGYHFYFIQPREVSIKKFLKIISHSVLMFDLTSSAYAQQIKLDVHNILIKIGFDKKHKIVNSPEEFVSIQERLQGLLHPIYFQGRRLEKETLIVSMF